MLHFSLGSLENRRMSLRASQITIGNQRTQQLMSLGLKGKGPGLLDNGNGLGCPFQKQQGYGGYTNNVAP